MNCPHCETEIDEHEANRCLDAWVAEAVMNENNQAFTDSGEEYRMYEYRPYSTDIAAAWEVVEKLEVHEGIVAKKLSVVPRDAGGWKSGRDGDYGRNWGEAETAPLAICRAALKAVYVGEG